MEETPCHFVTSLEKLVELNEKLLACQEFAVDLEVTRRWSVSREAFRPRCWRSFSNRFSLLLPFQHHSYRSFLGLTCLMQISTRTEDFVVDTLELRSDMYILNESFTDPAIVKVSWISALLGGGGSWARLPESGLAGIM